MTDYTPTTDEVRDRYAYEEWDVRASEEEPPRREAFDRWLAQRDREKKAEALRDAADRWPIITRDMVSQGQVRAWMLTEADRIEKEMTDD